MSAAGPRRGPSRAELLSCAGRTLAPVVRRDLDVLFCGIKPRPLHGLGRSSFRPAGQPLLAVPGCLRVHPRVLAPHEQAELLDLGLGITNVVGEATATAAELGAVELQRAAPGCGCCPTRPG